MRVWGLPKLPIPWCVAQPGLPVTPAPTAAPAVGCAGVTLGHTELCVKLCFAFSPCIALQRDLDLVHWETCSGGGGKGDLDAEPAAVH